MANFKNKPVEMEIVEAINFWEFIQYGKNNGANIVGGLPWSFEYKGCPVTNEHNELYLISSNGRMYRFTPQDMLITDSNGRVYPCDIDVFQKFYESV